MRVKKSFFNLIFWIGLAILFNIYIYFSMGAKPAIEFLGGYIIEMSLSLDNLFLFLMVFSTFNISLEYQERVLKYGIIGAMILRLIFILLGIGIINKFHFIVYIFGIILMFSGLKMIFHDDNNIDFNKNPVIKIFKKIMPVHDKLAGHNFFIRINRKLYATPLFIILIIIESSDVLFALDSIPAIFSITQDPFIVYTSNIFAIICLRSMYYILNRLNSMFKFMKYGVALILMFTGIKLLVLYFNIEISVSISILIILIILLCSILFSLIFSNDNENKNLRIR
ncbi:MULTISPECIES: TerC/Alx family metal homeostasis membrane protein [unclassified Clostridium]|uniref:TerC/Alx family metal homeostasis membrane protein n=1 Tax=unclassified Clostridium TaxID=2614128 RepID=UPI001896F215|nr:MULTISPECIES: TerC/Alx family metal homeostasis membrane protein [unclassified Clostridium]MCR1950074.1 TerC/Alx family metal homeostasis membrane protein [Clostridium sp. DSM 100503]